MAVPERELRERTENERVEEAGDRRERGVDREGEGERNRVREREGRLHAKPKRSPLFQFR